jgi:hypothetical protein
VGTHVGSSRRSSGGGADGVMIPLPCATQREAKPAGPRSAAHPVERCGRRHRRVGCGKLPNHRSPALRIWVDLHPLFPTTVLSCKARLHEEGDRRGLNPRPPLVPQSELIRSQTFTGVRKSANSGGFLESIVHWRSPTFARVVVKIVVNILRRSARLTTTKIDTFRAPQISSGGYRASANTYSFMASCSQ